MGELDVDVIVRDPTNVIVYNQQRRTSDDYEFVAQSPGEFEVNTASDMEKVLRNSVDAQ